MNAVECAYATGVFFKAPSVFLAGYRRKLDVAVSICREAARTGEPFRILLLSYPGNGKFTFALSLADEVERLDLRYRSGLLKVPLIEGSSEESVAAAEKRIRTLKAALARHEDPFLLIVKGASPIFQSRVPQSLSEKPQDSADRDTSALRTTAMQPTRAVEQRALDIREEASAWLSSQLDEVKKPRVILFLTDLRQPLPMPVLDVLEIPLYLPMPTVEQASILFARALMNQELGEAVAASLFGIGWERGVQYTGQELANAADELADELASLSDQRAGKIAAGLAEIHAGISRSKIDDYEADIKLLRDRSDLILRRWTLPRTPV